MIDSRKRRIAVFFIFLLLLAGAVALSVQEKERCCLKVEILSGQEEAALREYVYRDYSNYLLYNGQRAPVDVQTSTVYIAQELGPDTKAEDLPGTLSISSSRHCLVFGPDRAFEDLAGAAADNHGFRLYVIDGSGEYMQYNLVFTTLPVLRVDGEFLDYDQKGREIREGSMCLWTPKDPDSGRCSVKESNLQWHIRGGSSANQPKTPWRLSLKKKTGTNKNMALVGLGSDDDWFLNPMCLDDTKLKEQLFIRLWNQNAELTDWNAPMSRGEYVEVVMNGTYMGLFQLQRRIDGKFLELDPGDVLLKGGGGWNSPDPQTAYEIVQSPLPAEDTYALMEDFFLGKDPHLPDPDNFVDVNLFLEAAAAVDNVNHANMLYLLKYSEEGYRLQLLPWDTDMSWGTLWRDTGFVYDYAESMQRSALRREYSWMREAHPDLDRQMACRWMELRETLLNMETANAVLQTQQQLLDASGALKRDEDTWGLYYQGQDTPEKLQRFLEERLLRMDAYYGGLLQQ